jgi:hypothetical protein
MVYGELFPSASDEEMESLRTMGKRWKVRLTNFFARKCTICEGC